VKARLQALAAEQEANARAVGSSHQQQQAQQGGAQEGKRAGGPRDESRAYTIEELRALLPTSPAAAGADGVWGEELEGSGECEYVLSEGLSHQGLASVVRYAWRRRA